MAAFVLGSLVILSKPALKLPKNQSLSCLVTIGKNYQKQPIKCFWTEKFYNRKKGKSSNAFFLTNQTTSNKQEKKIMAGCFLDV